MRRVGREIGNKVFIFLGLIYVHIRLWDTSIYNTTSHYLVDSLRDCQLGLKPTKVRTHLGFGRHNLDVEWHDLLLGRDHAGDLLLLGELESRDPLEALLEMWLYTRRVLRLRQDLQQLIVGQEEEPMELWEIVSVGQEEEPMELWEMYSVRQEEEPMELWEMVSV